MKLTELFQNEGQALSFEVFPPKTDTAFESVRSAVMEIASLTPTFMSVTYGAGGGTSKYTLEVAKTIEERYGVPTVAHLTCVNSTRETVRDRIRDIHSAGIENIMALRGDILDEDGLPHEFRYATDLIAEIKASGYDFCIGGACYPETHPESKTQKEDIINLKRKVDAGCEFLTTQMFFDNNILYNFLYKIREGGITVPVIPGIMPITNQKQIERTVKLSNSLLPRRFLAIVDKFGENPLAMREAGIAYATEQIVDLFANGISYVHVYSMNSPYVAKRIQENLLHILNKI